jgi:hypothetical protein
MMQNNQKSRWNRYGCQMVAIGIFLFAASPSYAGSYGGYGHHYGYGYGYKHHGYYGHYSHHGHGSHLGYVLLGLTGIVLLSHLFNRADHYPLQRHYNPYGYHPPQSNNVPARQRTYSYSQSSNTKKLITPSYGEKEGWDWLAKGETEQALNIFAIQSQQNLNSGTPKIGFAIAAAINGDLDRGTRAMRRAIRVDPASLRDIYINKDLETKIALLSEEYLSVLQNKDRNTDEAFMVAALSYLKQDYATADNSIGDAIAAGDQDQSTSNLRQLINKKLNNIDQYSSL